MSLGGAEDKLRQGYGNDVARWKGAREVEGGRVVELEWFKRGLTGSIPAEIGDLDGLHELSLSYNEISGDLPSEISKLTSLTGLDVANNRLEGALHTDIGNFSKYLKVLFLSSNRATPRPTSRTSPTLKNFTSTAITSLRTSRLTFSTTIITRK